MPWCPKCGAEYVENVRKCKDCDVRLLDHKPTPDEMLRPTRSRQAGGGLSQENAFCAC